MWCSKSPAAGCSRSVSYTHLDVYKRQYVGTLTEGDILWGLKKYHGLDLEAAEDIPISEFAHKRDYKAVTVTTSMDELVEAAMSQNFVPVVDLSLIHI